MDANVLTLDTFQSTLKEYKDKIETSVKALQVETGDKALKEIKALTEELSNVQKSLNSVQEQQKQIAAQHVPGMKDEVKKWSWTSAIKALYGKARGENDEAAFKDAGLEREMMAEALKVRANVAGDGSLGGYLIPPEVSSDVIDMAIANMPIMSMGPTVIKGLYGDLPLPRKLSRTSAYMVGENEKATESNVTFGEAVLRPHKAAAFTKQSNRLIYQSRGVSDTIIKADLADAMSLKMEQQLLVGKGAGKETKGLFTHTGFTANDVSLGANGGRFRFDDAAQMIEALEEQDEYKNGGRYGFLMRPKVKSGMKRERVTQFSGQATAAGMPVLGMNLLMSDEMLRSQLGTGLQTTTLIPNTDVVGTSSTCSKVIFGNWALFYIAMWRDMIIKVSDVAGDGSTGSAFLDDQLYIVMFQEFDDLVMRESAFTVASGAETKSSNWSS